MKTLWHICQLASMSTPWNMFSTGGDDDDSLLESSITLLSHDNCINTQTYVKTYHEVNSSGLTYSSVLK